MSTHFSFMHIRTNVLVLAQYCRVKSTTDGGVLFEVLSADVDIFHQALARVSPPLLHGVLGAQSEHRHVLQRQTEAAKPPVELLGKTLSHLVALVLQRVRDTQKTRGITWRRRYTNEIGRRGPRAVQEKRIHTLMTSAHSWYCSSVTIS